MLPRLAATVLVATIVVVPGPPLAGQGTEATSATVPRSGVAVAVRVTAAAPQLDGRLDDEIWTRAEVLSGFIQRDPDEGRPGTERTEARVLYTDAALYVGVRAYDSHPEAITARLTRRDQQSPSDWIGVMIDSYYDRRTAFMFAVNPVGVKRDVYWFNDNDQDDRWDAVWDVATTVDDDGWSAEFRIPFSQLRFSSAHRLRFGFNVFREISRRNETQYWQPLPKHASGMVSRFGDLIGLEGISVPRRVEVLPYSVYRQDHVVPEDGNPFRSGLSRGADLGVDVNMGVTSNLTLSATINPDFGQVEADPAVVNLSAFETFFSERRPFFTEGLDIFSVRLGGGDQNVEQLFYTRRIGRAPQGSADPRDGFAEQITQTTILGAAKLSGKTTDGWTVGLTGALTGQERARVMSRSGTRFEDPVEPPTVYLVGRLRKDLRDGKTVLGAFGTTVDRGLPDNLTFLRSSAYAGGFDWTHRFHDDTYEFAGTIIGSAVFGSPEAIELTQLSSARYYDRPGNNYVRFDPTRTSLGGMMGMVSIGRRSGDWRWSTGVDTRSPGFEVNDVGFQRNADATGQYLWINRRWLTPGRVFRRFNVNFNEWSNWNYGWQRLNTGANVNANFTLANYMWGFFGVNYNFGGLNTGLLRGGPGVIRPHAVNAWGGFGTDDRSMFRAGIDASVYSEREGGEQSAALSTGLSWRPASNVELTFGPRVHWKYDPWQYLATVELGGANEYVLGELKQTTVSMTFRSNVTFAPNLSLELYAQPFMSAGHYVAFNRAANLRAPDFRDRFETFDADRVLEFDGQVAVDVNGDGTTDVDLGQPDFTSLSLRSNVVLRWEYRSGSTLFLVWQHSRGEETSDGQFRLFDGFGDIFQARAENTLLIKMNYWLSL